jgi:DNA-binding MarR family transcriptional regulator
MSKKPDRSSRKADLPDWADEVTPADEVMEKFYAPTGAFRSGPISVPKESADASPVTRAELEKDLTELCPPTENDISPVNTSHISAEDSYPQGGAHNSIAEVGTALSPSPITPEKLSEGSVLTSRPKPENPLTHQVRASANATISDSQTILFSEFADRWKRYLYPGQLAVMRALYELTFPQGTSECFTRYSELATSTKMSRRNCINVMNSLVERGFVERLEIRNDATGKGIRLRIHLDPLR